MNIAQSLVNAARTFPDRPAVSVGVETRHDYGELGHGAVQMQACGLALYLHCIQREFFAEYRGDALL